MSGTPDMSDGISVCIATFRRPERLGPLLEDLAAQTLLPRQVVVVDNDREASGRAVVEDFARRAPFEVVYAIEPLRGIARARNRTVALARGDWLAFIDDDERAPADWLEKLSSMAVSSGADGTLGPVVPRFPSNAPQWIKDGGFHDFPRRASGLTVPPNWLRFGNVLLQHRVLRAEPGPFDERYGLTTGEDGDLLLRLMRRGARILWCDEAHVFEPVEPRRLSLRWLLQRSYSRGQEFGRKTLEGRYGALSRTGRLVFLVQCAAKVPAAIVLGVAAMPIARHRGVRWLLRGVSNVGKLTAACGGRYAEYEYASASNARPGSETSSGASAVAD